MKTFLLATILALALAGCKTTNPVITPGLLQNNVSQGTTRTDLFLVRWKVT